jgi:hypothetical protein
VGARRESVDRRTGGRTGRQVLLAIAALAVTLTGVAACGNSDDTVNTGSVPTSTPSTSAPATAAPTAEPTTAAPVEPTSAPSAAAGPIVVETPAEDATVDRTFTVKGHSQTAEGTVVWALRHGDTVVENGFAEGGSDASAPFRFKVTAPAAGTYTLSVFEESAKDGGAQHEVTRTLTVR